MEAGGCFRSAGVTWRKEGPCGNYFPVIHVAGDVTLNSTQGQGLLLVDADLCVQGSFEWFGVVIVKGSLKTAGGGATGAHFWGMVIAANVDLDIESLTGNAVLNYSQCAIDQVALDEHGGPDALAQLRTAVLARDGQTVGRLVDRPAVPSFRPLESVEKLRQGPGVENVSRLQSGPPCQIHRIAHKRQIPRLVAVG